MALIEQDDRGKQRRALEYAETNIKQFPDLPDATSTYGWVLYKMGRVTDAKKVLLKTAASGNFSADTAYYIARVSADTGRPDDARRLLESALKTTRPFPMRPEAEALLKKLTP